MPENRLKSGFSAVSVISKPRYRAILRRGFVLCMSYVAFYVVVELLGLIVKHRIFDTRTYSTSDQG